MTDAIQLPTTPATEPEFGMLSSELFGKMLSQCIVPMDNTHDGVYCRFVFVPNKAPVDTYVSTANDTGRLLYTEENVSDLVHRYEQMLSLVHELLEKKFKILRLELAGKHGLYGAKIILLNPKGRKYEHNYFYPEEPMNFIPDEFLNDLKMFPSRHG